MRLMGMYNIIRFTAGQIPLSIEAAVAVGMNLQVLSGTNQSLTGISVNAFLRMDVLLNTAEGLLFHGNGRQNQCVGCAENDCTGHDADSFLQCAAASAADNVLLILQMNILGHPTPSFLSMCKHVINESD